MAARPYRRPSAAGVPGGVWGYARLGGAKIPGRSSSGRGLAGGWKLGASPLSLFLPSISIIQPIPRLGLGLCIPLGLVHPKFTYP